MKRGNGYYKGAEKITRGTALLLKTSLGSSGISLKQTSFDKEAFIVSYCWTMGRGKLHEDLRDNHQWVVAKTPPLHLSSWIFFFMDTIYNIKQFHSLVLSSKILERSSYYLSFDEGSSLEWLSSGWAAEIKRIRAILRWGHWMPTQQPFSFFLLSSRTLILFRYLLSFAQSYPWGVVAPSSSSKCWITIDRR